MSSLIAFTLLVRHTDAAQIRRIRYYLESETRPDFPEDVPESEADWVDAYEAVPYPERIDQPDDHTLLLFYDGDDLGELPEDIAFAIALSCPELVLSHSDLEDHLLFERWQDGGYEIVWDTNERYKEDFANPWDDQTFAALKALEERPEQVLLSLAEKLS